MICFLPLMQMKEEIFNLKSTDEYIELNKLLKVMGVAQTGGHAKLMIDDGVVKVNTEVESRKRKKLRAGDIVECDGSVIKVEAAISPDA